MEISFVNKIFFTCPNCNREFTLEEGQNGGVPFCLVKCPACGKTAFIDEFEDPD
jgi:transcription initiation factor IIE alpha subunit